MKVSILLSTYCGEKYLKQQLDSLFSQTHKNFEIIARDDFSSDDTLNILKAYDLEIIPSNADLGAKGSFSALLEHEAQNSDSDYFMFCDQDDVWEKDKIEQTLVKMQEIENTYSNVPVLVHTDLKVVDENLNNLNNSFWKYEHIDPSLNNFNRLLMQNTITGCSVMVNRKLVELALPIPTEAIMHDWWLGLVASKFGKIGFVNEPTIKYRQHSGNSIGAKGFSYINILKKGFSIFLNRNLYIKYLDINIKQAKAFLEIYKGRLDETSIEMLENFTNIEHKSFWQKRKILLKHKLLKQGLIRNVGLFLKI